MVEEEKVLKAVYELVKGDPSPVHLPVSPVVMSQIADLPLEQVQKCCHVLESHGCLISSKGISAPIYYITKMGVDQAKILRCHFTSIPLLPRHKPDEGSKKLLFHFKKG